MSSGSKTVNYWRIGGMTAAEALIFWLGGFSTDPKFPISGVGGPSYPLNTSGPLANNEQDPIEGRSWIIPLAVERLGPREGDDGTGYFDETDGRYLEYPDPQGGGAIRRINFWRYQPPNSSQPFVYFDASRHKPIEYDMPLEGQGVQPVDGTVFALKSNTTDSLGQADLKFVNASKFQVLHAGIDDDWGNFYPCSAEMAANEPENFLAYPNGPFLAELADTVVNFSPSTLEDSQP